MIVVDSSVVAYCWINGPLTATAQRVRQRDPEWHVPQLWRSEMRSILAGYLRDGTLGTRQVAEVMAGAEAAFAGREHLVSSDRVFRVIESTSLSAYDAEFVALAEALDVPLVTADRQVLKACPGRARTMVAFASRQPGGADSPGFRLPYQTVTEARSTMLGARPVPL
ncbi:MAG: type II toxin-antitoxin system VapC family toxin [Gammaproteobacteria bacterium]|nr:type II toxin-antitoxin system VapC family toxin [Gammaproteobacteria bacterium]